MNCLVLDPEEMRRARPNRHYAPPVVEAEVVEEPKKAAKAKPAAKAAEPAQAAKPAADDKSAILRETFDAKLREIRYLNDLIDDESVSARIDDIESNPAYLNSGLSVYSISVTITSPELKKYKRHDEIIEALRSLDYVYFIDEL